ncbi:MAG: nucleotidyl transferase AbiEii/AbiGii toxin family protein [Candidatus Aenigmarchaeota archaeon]|nr:nucleotidyl transferase AbiEii/AbiGii toxin family protein [Candidatus Aenigmarchaeota archaeon]MCK5333355.1 nucleotidyl transferase AbiEii/AbiGii toxin family protein [Candidatus Aenigmarchaeota archaeon]
MISKEMLMAVAKKKGLTNKEHIEKDYFQDLFLFHTYKKTNKLVFKGGTALYKLYGLPRFSEDLDFSSLENTDVHRIVSEVTTKTGAAIKNTRETKDVYLAKIAFSGILTKGTTIRVDIFKKNRVFGHDVKHYVPPYVDLMPFSLKVLGLQEILAEKIHAILARDKVRDVYDLFFLLRFVEPKKELVRNKLALFEMPLDLDEIKRKISETENLWIPEMRPFVLEELPPFEVVRDFIFEKLAGLGD